MEQAAPGAPHALPSGASGPGSYRMKCSTGPFRRCCSNRKSQCSAEGHSARAVYLISCFITKERSQSETQAQKQKKLCSLIPGPGYFHHHSLAAPELWLRCVAMIGDVGQQEDLEAAHRRPSLPERLRPTSKTCAKSSSATMSADVARRRRVWHTYLLGTRWRGP